MSEIVDRLLAACHGHPNAEIPWPHRPLHRAREEIERLEGINETHRRAQGYLYVGIDGKVVKARDLEDALIEARARIAELEARLVGMQTGIRLYSRDKLEEILACTERCISREAEL